MVGDKVVCDKVVCMVCVKDVCDKVVRRRYRIKNKNPTQRCGEQVLATLSTSTQTLLQERYLFLIAGSVCSFRTFTESLCGEHSVADCMLCVMPKSKAGS